MSEIPLRDNWERAALLAEVEERACRQNEHEAKSQHARSVWGASAVTAGLIANQIRGLVAAPAPEAAPAESADWEYAVEPMNRPVPKSSLYAACPRCGSMVGKETLSAAPAQAPPAPRAPSPDLVAQIRALRCYVMVRDMMETLVLAYDQENRDKSYPDAKSHEVAEGEEEWVRWADLAALLPPEDGQP